MTTSTPKTNPDEINKDNENSQSMGISGFAQAAESKPAESVEPKSPRAERPIRSARSADASSEVPEQPARSRPRSDVIRVQSSRVAATPPRNKFLLPVLAIVLTLLLGFMAYKYIFENVNFLTPIPGKDDGSGEQVSVPATEGNRWENPLNGMYFSNEDASKFQDRKPMAVMVNNYVIARPSAGLSDADVVYEAVAEGGITRLMPIFYSRIPEMVTSIRSARYYYVELASAYNPHYIHWGAAHVPPCQLEGTCNDTNPEVDAYARIVQLGLPNLDAGNYACQNDAADCTFGRDSRKLSAGTPLEHTGFVRLSKAYQFAKEIRPEESWHKNIPIANPWTFKDDAPVEDRGDIGAATPITYNYWDTMGGFNVKWEYDKENNEYVRYQGDVKQTDVNNGKELRAKSIIVRYTRETDVGDYKNHLYQQIVGTGDALIFQDGKVIQAKWTRNDVEELDTYTDLSGNEVQFVRGQIWVQLLQIGNAVNYQSTAPATIGGN